MMLLCSDSSCQCSPYILYSLHYDVFQQLVVEHFAAVSLFGLVFLIVLGLLVSCKGFFKCNCIGMEHCFHAPTILLYLFPANIGFREGSVLQC